MFFHTEGSFVKSVQKGKSQYTLHVKAYFIEETVCMVCYEEKLEYIYAANV
jgi:hypothetical protein